MPPVHDYVISNASGSAVRADLNNALAAIVSNNSNATSPATTYAFQFWADTTTGQLKIRNASNSAWITLMELDGTMLMEQGTASAPGLAFVGDLNTGIYRPAADAIGFATGGAERFALGGTEAVFNDPSNDVDFRVESNGNTHMLFVDAGNDRVGIGTSTPGSVKLEVAGSVAFRNDADLRLTLGSAGSIGSNDSNFIRAATDQVIYNSATTSGRHSFELAGSEKARIDSGGRLLLNTTNARANLTVGLGSNTIPAAGAATASALFSNATGAGDYGLIAGANSSGVGYLQAQRADGIATTYNLAIQPNGGNTGIGTSSPGAKFEVTDDAQTGVSAGDLIVDTTSLSADVLVGRQSSTSNDNTTFRVRDRTDNTILYASPSGDPFRVGRNGSEMARIDTSGRLIVGHTSVRSFNTHASRLQVQGTDFSSQTVSIVSNSADANGAYLFFAKQRSGAAGGNTIVQDDDLIGQLRFNACDGTDMETVIASVDVRVDGTPGSNDMPGRIEFRTTADGASGTTERARITQRGAFKAAGNFGIVDENGPNHEFNYQDGSNHVIRIDAASTSYAQAGGGILHVNCRTAHSSGWTFGGWYSGNVSDREFNFRGDGNGYADGSWNGGGADYAEFFEWSDGNAKAEDRRGISVVLDGDKIREAVAGEEPIGVISGNPSVVGDADIDRWKGKYLRDDYGTYIEEDFEAEDDDGNTVVQQRRKLNPDYDPDTEYVSRENRPEWDTVGLMGKLRIRKGQVTGTRWIKMRDVSDTVEEWLVR